VTDRLAIIHIGTPKTGTTSIQLALKSIRNELPAQGAVYPRSPGSSGHMLLTAACADGPHRAGDFVWDGIRPALRLAQFRAAFTHEMTNLPAQVDRVIFSDERLSTALQTSEQIGRLKTMLQPYFERFVVIVYLRRQDTLMASQYTQMLRSGMLQEPITLFDDVATRHYYSYDELLGAWEAVFGRAAVQPRIYERDASHDFDSVDDFLTACGLHFDGAALSRERAANQSINVAGQTILRETGRLLKERAGGKPEIHNLAWRAMTRAATQVLAGTGWTPTREEAMHFAEMFTGSNENVRRRYFPDRASLFSTDYSALPSAAPTATERELLDAACRTLVEALMVQIKRERRSEWQAKLAAKGDLKKPPHLAINQEITPKKLD
jgi:hypothetical protein